jgi:hypothetical protein
MAAQGDRGRRSGDPAGERQTPLCLAFAAAIDRLSEASVAILLIIGGRTVATFCFHIFKVYFGSNGFSPPSDQKQAKIYFYGHFKF